MSKRRRTRSAGAPRSREPAARPSDAAARPSESPWRPLGLQVGLLALVFAVVVGVAELAGAANLGVAIGIGTIAFAIVLMVVLLRS